MLRGVVWTLQQHQRNIPTHLCLYVCGSRRISWRTQSYGEYHFDGIVSSSRNPQIPLCERPAIWTSTKEDVLSWYREALDTISTVGDSLHADGGPLREDLELELTWVMEDAVMGWRNGDLSDDAISMRMSLCDLRAFLYCFVDGLLYLNLQVSEGYLFVRYCRSAVGPSNRRACTFTIPDELCILAGYGLVCRARGVDSPARN